MANSPTNYRTNLSEAEQQKLREIAERRGMSTRGVRDFALREFIRLDEESRKVQEEH